MACTIRQYVPFRSKKMDPTVGNKGLDNGSIFGRGAVEIAPDKNRFMLNNGGIRKKTHA